MRNFKFLFGGMLLLVIFLLACEKNIFNHEPKSSSLTNMTTIFEGVKSPDGAYQKFMTSLDKIRVKKNISIYNNPSPLTEEDYDCFDEEGSGCVADPNNPISYTITLNGSPYNGCYVLVTFNLYICYEQGVGGNIRKLVFDDFVADITADPSCDQFTAYLDNLIQNSQFAAWDAAMDAFYRAARDEAQRLTMTALLYSNPTVYQCNGSTHGAVSEFYSSTCYRWCLPSNAPINPIQAICGSQCCVKTQTWCLDGSNIVVSTASYNSTGSCTNTVETCMGTIIGDCDRSNQCQP